MNAPLAPREAARIVPDTAPFTPAQRAWLDGFLAGWLGLQPGATAAPPAAAPAPAEEEAYPWHDPALALEERLRLAADRPLARRLMAAMGQLDCGQCGYQCKEYAEAIAGGSEADLGRCVPGGKATQKALKALLADAGPAAAVPAVAAPAPAKAAPPEAERGYHREAPVFARLVASRRLTAEDSDRRVQHVVLDLGATGLVYRPGDSLGVWVRNNPEEVELILALLQARGSEPVALASGAVVSAREALSRECDLRVPTASLYLTLAKFARASREAAALAKLADDDADAHRLGIHEVLNTLTRFPSARPPVAEFVAALGRLQPRLYSIACSQRVHPGEVHLTIAVVSYELYARDYRGVASNFFAERLRPGAMTPIYVQRAHGFALPEDDVPIVMIGPGTGVAPFRAFLEERAARGAAGRNWLFFGNQRRDVDFLYREELEAWARDGLLTRLDTAFSREQAHKVYVQDRLRDNAAALWRWLEDGAHVYVCGDAKRMAADVDRALHDIVAAQGGLDAAAAKAYVAALAKSGRYQRDVY
jgi:sulfite reductase (NADPH) flavoprotein alpha-component